jgi:hypothetical protein
MESQAENDELYPIAVLIDELKVGCTRYPLADASRETASVQADRFCA